MIEFRTLLPSELEAWFDHCALVFNHYQDLDASRQYFMNHWYNDPWCDRHAIFVAVDAGEIASTVRVFHRRIYLAGGEFTMGGIGEVSTKAAYRRQGLSGKLLEMSVAYMEAEDLDFSMLGTGTPGHYSRYGWQEVPTYRQRAEVHPARSPQVRLINFQEPAKLMQAMELYHRYSHKFNGAIIRDHGDYWRKWIRCEVTLGWVPRQIGRGWVLQDGKEAIAYLVVRKDIDRNDIYVQDFACRGDVAHSFRLLAQHAVWSLNGDQPAQVVFPAVITSDYPVEWNKTDGLMIRVNNKELRKSLPGENVSDLFHGGKTATYGGSKLVMWGIDDF
ncbi:MAG: GNAT family N-acetyltransferase [Firmicutes bacterium]|nr:GNAT family N-acetyltransferase [Bacillota bacterium]